MRANSYQAGFPIVLVKLSPIYSHLSSILSLYLAHSTPITSKRQFHFSSFRTTGGCPAKRGVFALPRAETRRNVA
jgi:hypothetical protein